MSNPDQDSVQLLPNGGWDQRLLIVRCGTTVDAFIVITEQYVILVDTLLGPTTATAMLDLARPWLQTTRQLLVINTHADWDHCFGNQLFAGPTAVQPAPIIATLACAARFASGEVAAKVQELQTTEPARFAGVAAVAPTIHFTERLTIAGGDLTLELFRAPGHTDDHLAIFIPELQLLLAGDAAEDPFPFATSAQSLPQLRATLAHFAQLTPATVLYCHAPEQQGPTLIQQNIAYFDRIEVQCRAALAQGLSTPPTPDADLETLIGFPYSEALAGTDPSTLPAMYQEGHQAHLRMMLTWLSTEQP